MQILHVTMSVNTPDLLFSIALIVHSRQCEDYRTHENIRYINSKYLLTGRSRSHSRDAAFRQGV